MKETKINIYHISLIKRLFDIVFSLIGLVVFAPIICLLTMLIFVSSGAPVYFIQKRIGMNRNVFKIIKFRTMQRNANENQYKYRGLNEADGPVFKIYNDPRFTTIGKILSRFGLDELPQLVNVIKGDMSLVGPRPLPVNEANRLTKSQKVRELVKPGITSSWVIEGSHKLSFKEWMDLDRKYVENASFGKDIKIIIKTLIMLLT